MVFSWKRFFQKKISLDFSFFFFIHYTFIHCRQVEHYHYLKILEHNLWRWSRPCWLGLHQHPVEQVESHGVGVVLLHHLAKRVKLRCQWIYLFCILFWELLQHVRRLWVNFSEKSSRSWRALENLAQIMLPKHVSCETTLQLIPRHCMFMPNLIQIFSSS